MSEQREKDDTKSEKSWLAKGFEKVEGLFNKAINVIKKATRRGVEAVMGKDFFKKTPETSHHTSHHTEVHSPSTTSSDIQAPQSTSTTIHEKPTSHENKEVVSEVGLKMVDECETPGPYIGLSKAKREQLGIGDDTSEKDTVELFDQSGKSLGVFIVGKIKKEALEKGENVFTANLDHLYKDQMLTIRKTEKKIETKEKLQVSVKAPCESKGNYVGLSEYQRLQLGVKIGDTIEVLADGQHKGLYTVGEIAEDILKNKERSTNDITANHIDLNTTITLQKPKEFATTLPVEYAVENSESAKKTNEKGQKRDDIIKERFGSDPGVDTKAYITLPNALLHGLENIPMNDNGNFHQIAKAKVKIGDQPPQDMIVVPTDDKLGFTQAAQVRLKLSDQNRKKAQVKVEPGGILRLDLAS